MQYKRFTLISYQRVYQGFERDARAHKLFLPPPAAQPATVGANHRGPRRAGPARTRLSRGPCAAPSACARLSRVRRSPRLSVGPGAAAGRATCDAVGGGRCRHGTEGRRGRRSALVELLQPEETAVQEPVLGMRGKAPVAEAVAADAPRDARANQVGARMVDVAAALDLLYFLRQSTEGHRTLAERNILCETRSTPGSSTRPLYMSTQ